MCAFKLVHIFEEFEKKTVRLYKFLKTLAPDHYICLVIFLYY